MEVYEIVLLSLGIILFLLIVIVLIRAITFKPNKVFLNKEEVKIDTVNASKKFSDALKHHTVSHYQNIGTNYQPFQDFIDTIKKNYRAIDIKNYST